MCSQHLYDSFGTLCVQIGQLFKAQWVFEEYLQINKLPFLMENVAKVANVKDLQRRTALQIFGHKRYQKKRKDMS